MASTERLTTRVVVAAGELERREHRVGHRPRRQDEALVESEVFEIALLAHAVR